jgi:hypothetical protein
LAECKLNVNLGVDGEWLALPPSGSEAVLTGRINGLLRATIVKGATMRISRVMPGPRCLVKDECEFDAAVMLG